MKTQAIREAFQAFFKANGHTPVERSSLVPGDDPTLLFTNAGMVQFKDVFLGEEQRDYSRACTVQPCIRAGGKHNDLENVGYTARHHTFFEMLGNFSFGDYFKQEAIRLAWQFLTEVIKLPPEKLWVTVFEEDAEAEAIWLNEIGVDPSRLSRIGAKDNFWQMGDTGPCGPCTEIFYDHGSDIPGGPPGTPEEDGDRFIEIWNLVFMQYDRDAQGNLNPLPKPSVDTGMGIERLAAILQGVHDNYDTDTFLHLIAATAALTGIEDLQHKSLRVIADHIRSCSFLIVDGVMPGNEGRGYVLRRIIRRAIRHGAELGASEIFFHRLVKPLIEVMGDAYPELAQNQSLIEEALEKEEAQFLKTLAHGLKLFNEAVSGLKGDLLPGDMIFKLYDTYGFPVDLTQDIARERCLKLDMPGFEKCMDEQRERARSASSFKVAYKAPTGLDHHTVFVGYEHLAETATVEAIYCEGESVESLSAGEAGQVILPATPFYAESGGQVGDRGELVFSGGVFIVEDTQKQGDAILHVGRLASGHLKIGLNVQANVNVALREQIKRNHSATHLLHSALRSILGEHVLQKGSLVDSQRLRFDFSNPKAVSPNQLREIETLVNHQIQANLPVQTIETDMSHAEQLGAMMLFGEKYGEHVRVLKMGEFSVELCGGTHVKQTGQLGLFKILNESGVAAGIRRIEACSGMPAFDFLRDQDLALKAVADKLKAKPDFVLQKLNDLQDKNRELEKANRQLQLDAQSSNSSSLADQSVSCDGYELLVAELPGADPKTLRELLDQLKSTLKSAVIVLGVPGDDRVSLICGVTDNLTDRFKAGIIINHVATQVGGKGGGRADMAQAGGKDPAKLGQALASVKGFLDA